MICPRKNGRRDSLTFESVRVVDPTRGIDEALTVTVEQGVIAAIEPASRSGERQGARARRSSTRTSTCARPGREDEEDLASGTRAAAAGGYCAILAMPNTDPVVDSAAVLGALIEAAEREAEVPVGFLAAITKGQDGRRADGDGRARRARRGRLHGRRPAGRRAGPHAPRAPVQRRRRPARGRPLRGADALARRPRPRRARLGRARLRRLPVGRRERHGRARPRARRLRGSGRSTCCTSRPASRSRSSGAPAPPASRRPPRSRRTTSASRTRPCARSTPT